MARMRYIKPEFWTDSRMVSLSRDARLLYIGTWNFALCDKGHLEDDALRLKMQVFPADNVDVPALLAELMGAGRIVRVTNGEATWLQIVNLGTHQKVDPRWTPRCPACKASENLTETQESFGGALTSGNAANRPSGGPERASLTETLPNSPQEGIGGEGIGEETSSSPIADAIHDQQPREDVEAVCKRLADGIEGNGARRPAITKGWRDAARLLIDRDGYTIEQINWLIDWTVNDDFWKANVLSMPTFRKKFDQLRLKAMAGRGNQQQPAKTTPRDQWMVR